MAIIDVTDKRAFKSMVESCLEDAVNAIANATQEKIREEIQEQVYDASSPAVYKRTGSLLGAVSVEGGKTGDSMYKDAFIDPSLLPVSQGTFEFYRKKSSGKRGSGNKNGKVVVTYGIHANYKGESVSTNILDYIFGDTSASSPPALSPEGKRVAKHTYYGHEERPVIKNVYQWLGDYSMQSMANVFSSLHGMTGSLGAHSIRLIRD